MSRVALKIAYQGTTFHGFARQPGLRTVEGEVVHALKSASAIRDIVSSRFESASRTDRGVSAFGNVVAFDTRLAHQAAARAFNAKARDVWTWAAASMPPGFRVRRARERWYRYVLPGNHDASVLDRTLRVFEGEHDLRNFTKDRAGSAVRIGSATAARDGDAVVLDFRATSFRWNLVRRLVAAALRVEAGTASLQDLEAAFDGENRIDFGLAEPDPLTLMDILYEEEFEPVDDPTTGERLLRLMRDRYRSVRFYDVLLNRLSSRRVKPLYS